MLSGGDGNLFNIQKENENKNESKRGKRFLTDVWFFVLQVLTIGGWAGLVAYCFEYADLERLTFGYDSCNNMCSSGNFLFGNSMEPIWNPCKGVDMKDRRYLLVFRPDGKNSYRANYTTLKEFKGINVPRTLFKDPQRVCLQDCSVYPNFEPFKSRCILKKQKGISNRFLGKSAVPNFFLEIAEDLEVAWLSIILLEICAFGFSFLLTVSFAYLTYQMAWLVQHMAAISLVISAVYSWVLWMQMKPQMAELEYLPSEIELTRYRTYFILAMLSTVAVPLFYYIIFINKKKMKIINQMLQEACKIVTRMPLLFLHRTITALLIFGVMAFCTYSFLCIETSGFPEDLKPNFVIYKKNFLIILTRWWHYFVSLWMIHFFLGCQDVITAATVSFWYFCRNKEKIGTPVFYGTYNLLRFHLGSVSVGSLVTVVLTIPKLTFGLIKRTIDTINTKSAQKYYSRCINFNHSVFNYSTKQAYIEIAIRGYAYRSAEHQAHNILSKSDLHVTNIKDIGNFVLNFMKLLVCVSITTVGLLIFQGQEDILHLWILLILIFFFTYTIVSCFISVYQITLDTIFICLCEDYTYAGEISRLHYMTSKYLKLVQELNKALYLVEQNVTDNYNNKDN